jgi:hypothetical protein
MISPAPCAPALRGAWRLFALCGLLGAQIYSPTTQAEEPAAPVEPSAEGVTGVEALSDDESDTDDACVSTAAQIEAAAEAVRVAYLNANVEAVRAEWATTLTTLACAGELLGLHTAAKVHEAAALASFAAADADSARIAWASLLVSWPHYALSEDLAPTGHPLRALFDEAHALSPGTPSTVRIPIGSFLRLDGVRTEERFSQRAALVQVLTDPGEVLYTGYAWPTDPLPPPLPRRALAPQLRAGRAFITVGGLALAGGVAAGAAAMSLEADRREQVVLINDGLQNNPERVYTQYVTLSEQIELLSTAALGGGAVGTVAMAGGVVLIWRF